MEQPSIGSAVNMSKPLPDVAEGAAATSASITGTQQGRPIKAACISASRGDRPTVQPEEDTPTTGKRYPMQRRGSRKKTLSLNPEEREALENLIEEVIMGGVGEGVIDSDASSSDEDDEGAEDEQSPPSAENSVPGASTGVAVSDASKQDAFMKGGKKFYPGQLKVALKHMHDLPPRFVRKLAKAQQYLDAGGSMYSKPVVSVGRIEEEEETSAVHSKDDSKQPKSAAVAEATVASVSERDRDKSRLKENKLKDAKKMIRSLLTDRDQYVDETLNAVVVRNQSQSNSGDGVFQTAVSISSDQNPGSITQSNDTAAAQQVISHAAMSVAENTVMATAGSFLSVVTCTSEMLAYHPGNMSNVVTDRVQKTSDIGYRTGPPNLSTSGSRQIPAQPFHSPSLGIPQGIPPYQLGVPVVHGMKPAPVLSQSPPGTQFWVPEAVVPSNAPGFYGSSPPVMGMAWVPSAFNQPVPYAQSIQSSYPTVPGPHTSYAPQYLYSASPPSQGLVGQPYSAAAFSQPVSYPLAVPDHYVRPPSALPANFYQNTPPPGYCPAQSHPAGDQRHMFPGDMLSLTDGTRKQMVPADRVHKLSALSAPLLACRQSPTQPANCSVDARLGHTKLVCTSTVSAVSPQKCIPVIHPITHHGSGYQPVDIGANAMPRIRPRFPGSSPDLVSAASSQRLRFSRSPVSDPSPNPHCLNSNVTMLNTAAASQSQEAAQSEVSVVKSIPPTPAIEHSTAVLSLAEAELSRSPRASPSNFSSSISNAAVVSNSQLADESGSENLSCAGEREVPSVIVGCTEVSASSSTALIMMQGSSTNNVAEQPNVSCTVSAVVNDSDISGTAATSSVDEDSGRLDVVSSDAKDGTRSGHTGDGSGESAGGMMDAGSAVDQLASELQSELNREPEMLNRSSCDNSRLTHSPPNLASCSKLPEIVADEVADISLDCGAAGGANSDSSSDLVVTLSSRFISTLVDMFGSPAERNTHYGMLVLCHCHC